MVHEELGVEMYNINKEKIRASKQTILLFGRDCRASTRPLMPCAFAITHASGKSPFWEVMSVLLLKSNSKE